MDTVLSVNDLSIALGGTPILKNLSFEIKRGETAAVIGPNGAGKTVLFRALIGTVLYEGKIVWESGVKIGYVPQRFDLDRNLSLTVRDFLKIKIKAVGSSSLGPEKAAELVHLPVRRLSYPLNRLSGGELQRALIAAALIGDPGVLLFDEPTAGIDLPGEEQIYQTLHHIQDERNLTLIFISHDLNLVYRYADKVVCLSPAISCFGAPREILVSDVLDKLYGAKVLHHLHQHE